MPGASASISSEDQTVSNRIYMIQTYMYMDKEHAVFGWSQILSSLEAAVVLFLNANIAAKAYNWQS